jgi:hypothetical protein
MRVTDVRQQHIVELFVEEGLRFEKDDFEGVPERGYLSCLLKCLQGG